MPVLSYYQMYRDVPELTHATADSACMDVRAYFGPKETFFKVYKKDNSFVQYMAFSKSGEPIHTVLEPGDRALIPTGLILDIPIGYSVRIHPRSGLALKQGLTLVNCEGVVDSDYVEQMYIALINTSDKNAKIEHGDRIAQIELVQKLDVQLVPRIGKPEQKTTRIGGFGSTGVV